MARLTVLAVCLLTVSLTACTTLEERQKANGNFDYVKATEQAPFNVPDELDKPAVSEDFTIPALGENAPKELIGEKLTVVSPVLVLPLVTGSHVEEGRKEATVWFDQIDDSQPLDVTIWNSLISFLEEREIGVVEFDRENQRLITDWMVIESDVDNSWYTWTKTERSVGRRFEFTLDVKPHGRTAALKTKLRDYLETVGDKVIADINIEQERREEVQILNQVIQHYETQVRLADIERIKQIRSGFPMELGTNRNDEPAYIVDGQYDLVWPRLLLVLRKLGFNVKDLDKSNGLLFVSYGSADTSWWDTLFGQDSEKLNLDKKDYRIKVSRVGTQTSITLQDNESVAFELNKMTELFPPFSKTMAANNLDI